MHDCAAAPAGNTWGWKKASDTRLVGLASLARTSYGPYPSLQLDLGASAPNITAVRLAARADGFLEESQNLDVYISATPTWTASSGTLCEGNITFDKLGGVETVLCPTGFTSRYVTVVMNTDANNRTQYLSLQEVTPLWDGELWRNAS